ncbi:VanZ family protein [Microbacterium sp. cx-55]|uniref:VanZ family protein n=1 Tax=Microbacterium sp. cx-55 TaxID=2875948 RepID=UPI001CBF2EDB|nr:VanZ family protein [Microbacterium sp. cx-55]MBZ4486910.1 VanZ family protein [Microbacterium sp. cx-55]UGB35833.1 VanZ family protein [Microbacterium sp. cx-55]
MNRRRIVLIVALAVYGLAALVLLISPIGPGEIVAAVTGWVQNDLGWSTVRQGWIEFGANIALFVPLGFLLTGLFRRPWWGFALALVLSIGVELVQILLPARLPSPRDVLANALGAAVGAAIAWVVLIRPSRRARRPATRRGR